jgi:hypothetical protein
MNIGIDVDGEIIDPDAFDVKDIFGFSYKLTHPLCVYPRK